MDAANYGLPDPPRDSAAGEQADRLASWFVAAAADLDVLGSCGWAATAGSQASTLFRKHYMTEAIYAHTVPMATALEERGLFGGRVECYRMGRIRERVHMYDVRAMYPYCCIHCPVPTRLESCEENTPLDYLEAVAAERWCMADVELETESPDYPLRRSEDVVYPVGRFATTLCGPELSHALRRRCVRQVFRVSVYRGYPALANYGHALSQRRKASEAGNNQLLTAWIKALHVCLPGKFAQKERTWVLRELAIPPSDWCEWYQAEPDGGLHRQRALAGVVSREVRGSFAHGSVPAITAAITAAGRVRLLEIMESAGRENVYYCDTDAVLVNYMGRALLEAAGWCRPGEIGYLQHVESADECEISGVRHYRIGERVRESGRPRGERGEDAETGAVWLWPWIGASLRAGARPDAERLNVPYSRAPRYAGGVVADDGRVHPHRL